MLFNFNNWNNSGKKEYDSKKKKKRKNYIHNFQQIFRPETISSNQFLYYIVHYKCNQCTKCSFIIQKHIYKGRRRGGGREETEEGFLLEEPENRSSQLRGFTVSKEITFRILHEYGTTRRRIVCTVPSGSVSGLPPCPYVSKRRTACSQRNDTNCIVREEKLFRGLRSLL